MEDSDTEDVIGDRGDNGQSSRQNSENKNSKVSIMGSGPLLTFKLHKYLLVHSANINLLFSLERIIVSLSQIKVVHIQKANHWIMNITTSCMFLEMLLPMKLRQHIKN